MTRFHLEVELDIGSPLEAEEVDAITDILLQKEPYQDLLILFSNYMGDSVGQIKVMGVTLLPMETPQ